jgi:transposase-like protein
MSGKGIRRHFTAEDKVKILREHLERKRPISELCEQYGLDPSQFSQWKKALFEGAVETFTVSRGRSGGASASERHAKEMEEKLTRMQKVVSEIAAENIELKKRAGN